jgi:hypothetical protein
MPQESQKIVDQWKAPAFHLMRDAYVELHGLEVEWYRANEGADRENEYGHVKRNLTFLKDKAKVVLEIGAKELELLATFDLDTTESYDSAIVGRIKYASEMRKGDRIAFSLAHFQPGSNDRRVLECVKIVVQASRYPIGKHALFTPSRDGTIT